MTTKYYIYSMKYYLVKNILQLRNMASVVGVARVVLEVVHECIAEAW